MDRGMLSAPQQQSRRRCRCRRHRPSAAATLQQAEQEILAAVQAIGVPASVFPGDEQVRMPALTSRMRLQADLSLNYLCPPARPLPAAARRHRRRHPAAGEADPHALTAFAARPRRRAQPAAARRVATGLRQQWHVCDAHRRCTGTASSQPATGRGRIRHPAGPEPASGSAQQH